MGFSHIIAQCSPHAFPLEFSGWQWIHGSRNQTRGRYGDNNRFSHVSAIVLDVLGLLVILEIMGQTTMRRPAHNAARDLTATWPARRRLSLRPTGSLGPWGPILHR